MTYRLTAPIYLFATLLSCATQAATTYFVSHMTTETLAINDSNTSSSPIDYDYAYQAIDGTNSNFASGFANVDPGTIRIDAEAFNNGVFAPNRQNITASFTFDVIFNSTGATNIDVVMNAIISGEVGFVPGNGTTINVSLGPVSSPFLGTYSNFTGPPVGSGLLAGFVDDGQLHTLATSVMTLPVNTPIAMVMSLTTSQAFSSGTASTALFNQFSFTEFGDVFTIIDDGGETITIDAPDTGIIDNRYGAGIVPVPAAIWLFVSAASVSLGFTFGSRHLRRS